MNNYPDDWNCYYRTCWRCGGVYHTSGTVTCDCKECTECGELVEPEEYSSNEMKCDKCGTCEECGCFDKTTEYRKEHDMKLCFDCNEYYESLDELYYEITS